MRVCTLLMLSLALLAGALAAQENPVTNGGFERLDEGGFPADWSPVSEFVTVTDDAHSGQRALRFARPAGPDAPPEVGLNRAWAPESGEQGKMLAETRGGLIFWYKVVEAAPTADLSIQVIPMNDRAWEDTGESRVICRLPRDRAGDGQWHEGRLIYDFSAVPKVKWVHVGVRVTGGPAVLVVDDIRYVAKAGPILTIEKVHLYPDAARPGAAGELTASIANTGDSATGPVQVSLGLPEGLSAPQAEPLPALVPGAGRVVKWRLAGPLRPGKVVLHARDAEARTEYAFPLAPRVEPVSLLARPSLTAPDGVSVVTATFWNRGTATAAALSAELSAPPAVKVEGEARCMVPAMAPGAKATVRWRVRAPRDCGEHALRCTLEGAQPTPEVNGAPLGTAAALVVTDAVAGKPASLTPLLRVRTGTDRSVGELVLPGKPEAVCARLPHLGRVSVRLPDGSTQTLLARHGAPRGGVITSTVHDRAGGVWSFRATARALSPSATRLEIRAACSRPRTLLLFEGPVLLAGEGGTGDAKREAIFPGLEWLAPDEVSSSDLDIAPDHADRLRFLPHPHKVTIPAMGVQTPAGTVGLLWDVHQRWDGERELPQPLFAAPDRLLGASAHRMGLVAPNVAAGLPENALSAEEGYALAANRALTLSAVIYADASAGDSLAVMDEWFRRLKPAPVLPAPRGSDVAQVAWSMGAYTKALWLSPEEGWLPFLGGPAIWRKPAFSHAHAYDLEQAARIAPKHPEAREWLALRETVRPRIEIAQGDDLGFAGPRTMAHFGHTAVRAYQLIVDQDPDGSWHFDADRRDDGVFKGMDYHELGMHGAEELGIIARNAYEILLYARISGDESAYRAGVKTLDRMQRFTIPRAAQVWEVPVHSPDILAAADAVDAYLEAYRFTQRDGKPGEARWLREAQRWARAGLPFVYVWDVPGKPWMRYGSIPVFGASWYFASWYGNIVQWNGLRHAYALLKLHELDPQTTWGGLSWRDLALGITRCAMYQQATEGESKYLWPDSYHTVTDARAGWDFTPRLILKNVYALLGRIEEPRTVAVSAPGGTVRVSASAVIEEARVEGGQVRVRVRRQPGETGSVMVAGITRPKGVRVDGQAVAAARNLNQDGWHYDEARRLLAVPAGGPKAEVLVEGVSIAKANMAIPIAERIAFEFDEGTEGWLVVNDLAPLETEAGALVLQANGGDPYMHRHLCRIEGDSVRDVVLRIRGTGDGAGQFYWVTKALPGFDEAKVVLFPFATDGEWHEVVIPVGEHPLWRGQTITTLRIDPGSTPGSRVEIDWIRGR